MPMSAFQKLWHTLRAKDKPEPQPAVPSVIVHDPEARKPHDLDDPYFDRAVQSRMANVIAHTGHKK